MSMIFFTFPGELQARMGASVLTAAGIPARMKKTPGGLNQYGCSYGVQVPEVYGKRAAGILKGQRTSYVRSYRIHDKNKQEVFL